MHAEDFCFPVKIFAESLGAVLLLTWSAPDAVQRWSTLPSSAGRGKQWAAGVMVFRGA